VKTRSKPPKIIRKTKELRIRLKRSGREGWMFFNPTMGTYQNKKISKKRIKQVKTNSPIKILFWGLVSNGSSQKVKLPACPARPGQDTYPSKWKVWRSPPGITHDVTNLNFKTKFEVCHY
jgi:hypothetical protein